MVDGLPANVGIGIVSPLVCHLLRRLNHTGRLRLFMIKIDHLIYNDYVCNPLLNDLVIDIEDELGVDSAARDSDQTNFPDCFTYALVNVRSCEVPRSVLQADTIVVSCGLANFEQSSWSTHRRREFWGTHEELHTKEDYDKFVRSFNDNYPGICDGRSIWTMWSLAKVEGRASSWR